MNELVENVLSLAIHGSVIDEPETVDLGQIATDTSELIHAHAASLVVNGDCEGRVTESESGECRILVHRH